MISTCVTHCFDIAKRAPLCFLPLLVAAVVLLALARFVLWLPALQIVVRYGLFEVTLRANPSQPRTYVSGTVALRGERDPPHCMSSQASRHDLCRTVYTWV